jgi:hypothetical protein
MNYSSGDFKGITYTDGDYHTQGQSGFGGIVDSAKSFVSDNKMMIVIIGIAALGLYSLKDDGPKIKSNPSSFVQVVKNALGVSSEKRKGKKSSKRKASIKKPSRKKGVKSRKYKKSK